MRQTLPAHWRRKVSDLEAIAEEARAAARGAADRIGRVQAEIDRLERRRKDLRNTRSLMPVPGRDVQGEVRAELAEVEAQLKDATARRAELRELRQDRDARSGAASSVFRRVDALLTDYGPDRLADAEPVEPEIQKGETLAAALERTRTGIKALRETLAETQAAGLPPKELKARARAHVEWLAEQGRPRIEEGKEGVSILWPGLGPERSTTFEPNNPAQSPAAFLAWLDPKLLIARLEAEIDALPRDGLTLNPKDKAAQVADLEAAILAAERAEEALIAVAIAAGFNVTRRPDADARAVLGVEISTKAEKEAA